MEIYATGLKITRFILLEEAANERQPSTRPVPLGTSRQRLLDSEGKKGQLPRPHRLIWLAASNRKWIKAPQSTGDVIHPLAQRAPQRAEPKAVSSIRKCVGRREKF